MRPGDTTFRNDPVEAGAQTVIVDEASMLTEEMLAALIQSLKGVRRLLLIGDHRQLPPIGAGRPFFDIVRRLASETAGKTFRGSGQGMPS
ncbi:MAG: AAA family ATPase [Xanthomonadales bacterium]|nr:AAA family ATPase [Xanthomonadales bacterium]